MLQVYICVGSSCHLRGSYHIIKTIQDMIRTNKLEEKVNVKASFCLGNCTTGVSVKIDDEYVGGFTPANAEQMFRKLVLEKIDSL